MMKTSVPLIYRIAQSEPLLNRVLILPKHNRRNDGNIAALQGRKAKRAIDILSYS